MNTIYISVKHVFEIVGISNGEYPTPYEAVEDKRPSSSYQTSKHDAHLRKSIVWWKAFGFVSCVICVSRWLQIGADVANTEPIYLVTIFQYG